MVTLHNKKHSAESNSQKRNRRLVVREMLGLLLLFWGLFLLLTLVTYNHQDPGINHVVSTANEIHNSGGMFGAYLSGLLVDLFGLAAFVWPALFLVWGAGCFSDWFNMPWWRWMGFVLLTGCLITVGAAWQIGIGDVVGGGMLGLSLYKLISATTGYFGSGLIWLFVFCMSIELAFGLRWMDLLQQGWYTFCLFMEERKLKHRFLQTFAKLRGADPNNEKTEKTIALLSIHTEDSAEEAPPVMGYPSLTAAVLKLSHQPPEHEHFDSLSEKEETAVKKNQTLSTEEPHSPIEDEKISTTTTQSEKLLTVTHTKQISDPLSATQDIQSNRIEEASESAKALTETAGYGDNMLPVVHADPTELFAAEHENLGDVDFSKDNTRSQHLELSQDNALSQDNEVSQYTQHQQTTEPSVAETVSILAPVRAKPVVLRKPSGKNTYATSPTHYEPTPTEDFLQTVNPLSTMTDTTDSAFSSTHIATQQPPAQPVLLAKRQPPTALLEPQTKSVSPPQTQENNTEKKTVPHARTHVSVAETESPVRLTEALTAHQDLATHEDFVTQNVHTTDENQPDETPRQTPDDVLSSALSVLDALNTPPEQHLNAQTLPESMALDLPPVTLLSEPTESDQVPDQSTMNAKGEQLMTCIGNFGVRAELVRVTPGPVVTLFELRPAPGVKVSRILGLTQDIAMSLKALAVRIHPIPGQDTVGIEIPNESRATVNFRRLLESSAFQDASSLLTLTLGADISGKPVTADLMKMPHLLVGGTTGSGKSVCINALLLSLLYKATPNEMRLLLIDPKVVELAMYKDLPHLIHPVVSDPGLAKNALEWVVHEMDQRYARLSNAGVRNIQTYNERIRNMDPVRNPELIDMQPMPYLVIVVDELADLMLTAGKDVETAIVRLAQLARAAGIHLIIATQRPSVDVVTGLIKANFPSRVAFKVSNGHDSRTILDTTGADALLGNGDMLFKPSGTSPRRLHGPYVSEEDVEAVVGYWKSTCETNYVVDFAEWGAPKATDLGRRGDSSTLSDEDAMYAEIVQFALEDPKKLSISKLQRRFRIGFNKAARFVERMQQDGIIPPPGHANRARDVITD